MFAKLKYKFYAFGFFNNDKKNAVTVYRKNSYFLTNKSDYQYAHFQNKKGIRPPTTSASSASLFLFLFICGFVRFVRCNHSLSREGSRQMYSATTTPLRWTHPEDLLLLDVVAYLGTDWDRVCTILPKRSASACRKRYCKLIEDTREFITGMCNFYLAEAAFHKHPHELMKVFPDMAGQQGVCQMDQRQQSPPPRSFHYSPGLQSPALGMSGCTGGPPCP